MFRKWEGDEAVRFRLFLAGRLQFQFYTQLGDYNSQYSFFILS